NWLATEHDKLAHFTTALGATFPRSDLPQLQFGSPPNTTTRYFPDKLPIGLLQTGETVFTFLVKGTSATDFRTFLQRHAELLRSTSNWQLRLVLPRHLARCERLYLSVVREELLSPMRLSAIEELRWYFQHKMATAPAVGSPAHDRRRAASAAFDSPRFSS